jgi:hypothetical protein
MKRVVLALTLVTLARASFGTTLIVDKYGGGQFTSIQPAIDAASPNDTVKVWPGDYSEQVNLNKNITLMGSGYENTRIVAPPNTNPAAYVSSGRLQWFYISNPAGRGIIISGGIVRNCAIVGCTGGSGIYSSAGSSTVMNCVIVRNSGYGIESQPGAIISATNCISRSNTGYGFWAYSFYGAVLNLSYSNGSVVGTTGNQGVIDKDPVFTSDLDFHISEGSPCWNAGNPSYSDPDGSLSDMGYFGGPDCPIYPVVTQIIISPSGNTITLSAKARANY